MVYKIFTKFSPIPTQPKNVDQHNLPVVEKSARVLEESNNNNTNQSFDNILDNTPMTTSKNSFSSTKLHPRSSISNDESTTSLVNIYIFFLTFKNFFHRFELKLKYLPHEILLLNFH